MEGREGGGVVVRIAFQGNAPFGRLEQYFLGTATRREGRERGVTELAKSNSDELHD